MDQATALQNVVLPLSIITIIDLSRVGRELEALNEFMVQSAIRTPGTSMALPRLSKLLDDAANANKLNLLEEKDRQALLNALGYLKMHAPKMHISFSAEPSGVFIGKIAEYIRKNISPVALIQVGLQPTIAAGCILRTPNHQFDLSLRQHLRGSRGKLSELIHAVTDTPGAAMTHASTPASIPTAPRPITVVQAPVAVQEAPK